MIDSGRHDRRIARDEEVLPRGRRAFGAASRGPSTAAARPPGGGGAAGRPRLPGRRRRRSRARPGAGFCSCSTRSRTPRTWERSFGWRRASGAGWCCRNGGRPRSRRPCREARRARSNGWPSSGSATSDDSSISLRIKGFASIGLDAGGRRSLRSRPDGGPGARPRRGGQGDSAAGPGRAATCWPGCR